MKDAKADVNYSEGHTDSHCGPLARHDAHSCQHFQIGFRGKPYPQGGCTEVAGPINPTYWCKLWEKKSA